MRERKLRTWITIVGWSPFAVINPIWAACFNEEYIPNRIILLNNGDLDKTINKNVEIVKIWLNRILSIYDVCDLVIEDIQVNEKEILKYAKDLESIIEKYKEDEIAIDMTPGRKFMSSVAIRMAFKHREYIDKLYYLHLLKKEYQNEAFIKIPFVYQNLINFLEL